MATFDQMMAMRRLALNQTPESSFGGRLPQPLTDGTNWTPSRTQAPVYSASGLTHVLDAPYLQAGGMAGARQQPYAPANPGTLDPLLGMGIKAGDSGGWARGASAFLGAGFNPWTRDSEGNMQPTSGGQIDSLFQLAQNLGIDTSKYTRDPGTVGIRGERSGTNDAMALYDEVNKVAKDYVSVIGLSGGWSGGGLGNMARTIYKEQDGKLLPVTAPTFMQRRTNNGFISRDAIQGMSLMLPALGGWAGLLGQGAEGTLTAGSGLGLTTSIPNSLVNFGVNTLLSGGRINPMGLISAGLGANGGTGGADISPMSYYQAGLGSLGLGRTPVGQASSLRGLAGMLSRLAS